MAKKFLPDMSGPSGPGESKRIVQSCISRIETSNHKLAPFPRNQFVKINCCDPSPLMLPQFSVPELPISAPSTRWGTKENPVARAAASTIAVTMTSVPVDTTTTKRGSSRQGLLCSGPGLGQDPLASAVSIECPSKRTCSAIQTRLQARSHPDYTRSARRTRGRHLAVAS
jgi:hypothetical protein